MKLSEFVLSLSLATLISHFETFCQIDSSQPNLPDLLRDITYSTLNSLSTSLNETSYPTVEPTINLKDHYSDDYQASTNDNYQQAYTESDRDRNVSEIIKSRGFEVKEYDVVTRDGYILTVQRIINPLVVSGERNKLRPVIMQHGLMSSSIDWVINSRDIRPTPYPENRRRREQLFVNKINNKTDQDPYLESQEHPNSLGFYLANQGFDVFLSNSRGNIYGQRHISLTTWDIKFWDFSFDEQIAFDIPDTIAFVQNLTGHHKVGYVGHSQGTSLMFGLLSEKPEYANIVEPFVALAPVAYVDNTISIGKFLGIYISSVRNLPMFQHINVWFASSNTIIRFLTTLLCGNQVMPEDVCNTIFFLTFGYNQEEIDNSQLPAYLSHFPAGTSAKNIAHYGQEVLSHRFAKYDYGTHINRMRYGQDQSPDYNLSYIESKSIALFFADNDWLSVPKDLARLRANLRVQPFALVNMTEVLPKWSHIDFLYGKHAGKLINTKVFEIFDYFRKHK